MIGLDPETLLGLPASMAETALNELTLDRQASLVLMTPWDRRYEVVLMSRHARVLVQGLPVEELFWTVKATGPGDALDLIRLASPEQLQFFFDLDWWHKDDLLPEKVAAWAVILIEAGDDVLRAWLRWIAGRDESIIPAVLRPFVRVCKRPDEMDIQEARDRLPSFTLDDVYYLDFMQDGLASLWGRFLTELFGVDAGLYRDVMETVLWESGPEVQEQAYRLRRSRLGDSGIPEYYESLDIYAPLPENRIRTTHGFQAEDEHGGGNDLSAFVPTLYMGDHPLLRAAVSELAGTADIERVLMEWVQAANKVLMVEAVDFDDVGALKGALLRVAGLLNLGLETAAVRSGTGPGEILRSAVVEDLVRLAVAQVRPLATRARTLVHRGLVPRDLFGLPDSWQGVLLGLLDDRSGRKGSGEGTRSFFESSVQLASARETLDRVEAWAGLMAHVKPHWSEWSRVLPWDRTNLGHPRELTWGRALLTALANATIIGEPVVRPVPETSLSRLRRAWFSGSRGLEGCPVPPSTVEACVEALAPSSAAAGLAAGTVGRMVAECLGDIQQEWEGVNPEEAVDGRYVSALLVGLEE